MHAGNVNKLSFLTKTLARDTPATSSGTKQMDWIPVYAICMQSVCKLQSGLSPRPYNQKKV